MDGDSVIVPEGQAIMLLSFRQGKENPNYHVVLCKNEGHLFEGPLTYGRVPLFMETAISGK